MYYINDKGFSYLLFPKKRKTDDNVAVFKDNVVDMLYYYLNKGVPVDCKLDPIIVTQECVNQYGLDALVLNLQRHYKYDYDIVVVKVPQEYMRMEPNFGESPEYPDSPHKFSPKVMPLLARHEFNGKKQEFLPAEYIESIYLKYPECHRIINDNWQLISRDSLGMVLHPIQEEMLRATENQNFLAKYVRRKRSMEEFSLTTKQMYDVCIDDKERKDAFGYDDGVIKFIRDKYAHEADRIYSCNMSKNRIKNLISIEHERVSRQNRMKVLGD